MPQVYPSPAPVKTPRLHLVQDEEGVPYDGSRPRRDPFAMIPRHVLEEHAAKVGIVAWGVFTALAHHADADGRCYPSTTRLAKLLGIHRVTVSDAIGRLVAAGLVVVEERRTETGARTSNAYILPCLCLSSTATGVQSTATAPVVHGYSPRSPRLHKQESVNENQMNEGVTPPTPRKRSAPDYSEDFEAFWRSYPKGGGNKVKAFDQWRRLRPDDELRAAIADGLDVWTRSDRWRRGFVKAADIWLRDRWWEDDPPLAASPNGVHRGKDIGLSTEELVAMGRGER